MAEENQAQPGPAMRSGASPEPTVPTELEEPQQVTAKDPKKVEAGKRLAALNHKKREANIGTSIII